MDEYKTLSYFARFKVFRLSLAFNYSIGVGGKSTERVCISRKSGYKWMKYLMPWLHTLEKSRDFILHMQETREFSDQLFVAYEKWKRVNMKG